MAFLSSMNVVGSGLTAQQLRLDVVSENITNRTTTRTEGGGAYRRKMVVFEAEGERSPFQAALDRALGRGASGTAGGVRVTEIVEDPSDFKLVYDPEHPDANGGICRDAQRGSDAGDGGCHGGQSGLFGQCDRIQCAQTGGG